MADERRRGRFAPTTSGSAHPGTFLSALLCWLDARAAGGEVLLRLEDIDPERCTPESGRDLRQALAWFGLDWDGESRQSGFRERHEAALDRLADAGRLYPCSCSRRVIRAAGDRAADGGWRYPGTCRERRLPSRGWRGCREPIRFRLDPGPVAVGDVGGLALECDALHSMGDPVVRRRDGEVAYHLAVVVDDAAQRVTRIVRGRDLASSTAIHAQLQRALGLPRPNWRHHFLLLEERGSKLAKLHGSVGWHEISRARSGAELCGWLARVAGLRSTDEPVEPRALIAGFGWSRVPRTDRVVRWTGERLVALASLDSELG